MNALLQAHFLDSILYGNNNHNQCSWVNTIFDWSCNNNSNNNNNQLCFNDNEIKDATRLIDDFKTNTNNIKTIIYHFTKYVQESCLLTSSEKTMAEQRILADQYRYDASNSPTNDALAKKMEIGFANYLIAHNLAKKNP